MDQDVIHSLKVRYRRLLMISNLKCIENSTPIAINLLDAIEMVAKAWQQVAEKTIENCFKHAWLSICEFDEDDDLPLNQWLIKQVVNEEDDDNLSLSVWLNKINLKQLSPTVIDAYVDVDKELVITICLQSRILLSRLMKMSRLIVEKKMKKKRPQHLMAKLEE